MSGKCFLVGAGPGDIGLVTLRAKQLVERADVMVYDYLANPEILTWTKPECEIIYVGKKGDQHTMPQKDINQLLVNKTREGLQVVRLKGGDPFVFGRGGEEVEALKTASCEFEVVPGVTSAVAAAAYAGIPLTHRGFNSSVTFLTGHEDPAKSESAIRWRSLVELGGTLAIYMGMERLGQIMTSLIQNGMPKDTPASVIEWGSTPQQKSVSGTVSSIVSKVESAGISSPAIIVVGGVAGLADRLAWFEKKPLHGKRIVLTRTRDQASRMKDALLELGADVWELPTIQVNHIPWSKKGMIFPAQYDWVIFSSPNSVDAFFDEYIKAGDIREWSGIRMACIGPATRVKLESRGIRVDFVPPKYTAETLVSSWPEPGRILFPCGNLADKTVERGLTLRKCKVTRLEVYETKPAPAEEDRSGIRQRIEKEGADWVIFASSSAVENFHALNMAWKKDSCHFASFGPMTTSTMRRLGYSVDYEVKESRMDALISGLTRLILSEKGPSWIP